MKGDAGPYIETDGPGIWVPRTVPYLEARRIARTGMDYDDRLVYRGKVDGLLLGFARDCLCEEVCELLERDEYGDRTVNVETPCRVPAWAFEAVER
jgi:hypothetical protein